MPLLRVGTPKESYSTAVLSSFPWHKLRCNQVHKEVLPAVSDAWHFNFSFVNTVWLARNTANTSLAWSRPCWSQRRLLHWRGFPSAHAQCRWSGSPWHPQLQQISNFREQRTFTTSQTCQLHLSILLQEKKKKEFCKNKFPLAFENHFCYPSSLIKIYHSNFRIALHARKVKCLPPFLLFAFWEWFHE